MLLRRITQHVKSQNWFAVGIDFVIVVVGVFIGIQVSNWNETRVEFQRERALIERLHLDFVGIVTWGEKIMPTVNAAPGEIGWLIEQIRADSKPELGEKFTQAASASIELFATFEMSPTYQELVSTGNLSRISNPELRDWLANYGRSRQAEMVVTNGLYALQNKGVMRQAIRFHVPSDYPEQSFDVGGSLSEITIPVSFDWEALKRTEPHLHLVMQNHDYVRGWKQDTFRDAQRVLKLLNQELE
ncbi:MAG: hypothetical protein AAF351_01080 [Pseudomonadota bacterium]